MFFKRGGGGTETMFTQDEMKTCMHKLSIHRIKFIILLPKYRCVIDSLVGQLRLESQGSNRIGYVTELLATEHHRNSDGARVLTPTQECKQCALIQLNKWTLCFESMSLQISLQSFRHCAGSVEQLLHWLVFISQEALLVLSIIIICYYRQEKAFWDWISIAIFKSSSLIAFHLLFVR